MEWVYDSDQEDEPVLYEGDGLLERRETDLSTDAGSDVTSANEHSAEFFGDDVDELRLSPTEAFSQLASLILGHHAKGEFRTSDNVGENGKLLRGRKTTITESREERIQRLRQEIEDLAKDPVPDANKHTANIFSTFRDQLSAIEQYTSSLSLGNQPRTHIDILKTVKEPAIDSSSVELASGYSAENEPTTEKLSNTGGNDGVTVTSTRPIWRPCSAWRSG